MAESYGWAGKILRVNLTTGEITTQDDEKYHKYIGGMGMAYRIMYEEAPMELDPYDEKALVIFGVGPLTGAGVPCSGRMNVTFRSTWSKGHSIIDAHMGGHIGSMLKYAGYDGIRFEVRHLARQRRLRDVEAAGRLRDALLTRDHEKIFQHTDFHGNRSFHEIIFLIISREGKGASVSPRGGSVH